MSNTVTSKDGTRIAYEKSGQGPAVVIVGGVAGDRSQQAPLATLLAKDFTVFNFDRRGHGESGMTEPYAVEREIEDIDAIIGAAGGSALVYGTSGCAVLALLAAAGGLASKMKKLALWEPPFIVDDSRPKVPADYRQQLTSLLAQNRRGDMVELFMTAAVGMPKEFVAPCGRRPFGLRKRRSRTRWSTTRPSWATTRCRGRGSRASRFPPLSSTAARHPG